MTFGALSCSNEAEISRSIRDLVRERKAEYIRLADATSFNWDQVYLFGPYVSRSQVCGTLKLQAEECARQVTVESTDDGDMSIAFLAQGQLVRYARHTRKNGDFTPVPQGQPLSPNAAVFRVVRDEVAGHERIWLKLVPR